MVKVKRVLPCSRPRPALAIIAVLLPVLAGCILTNDKLDPALDVPDSYGKAKGSPHGALPTLDWWRAFRSPELTDLMEQAQTANLDIAAAIARVVQAHALSPEAGAALLPIFSASGTTTRSRTSANTATNATPVTHPPNSN